MYSLSLRLSLSPSRARAHSCSPSLPRSLPAPHSPTFDLYTTGGVAKQRLDLLASIELNE